MVKARLSMNSPLRQRLAKFNSGELGIRTLDTVSRIHTFQACSFSHSDNSPVIFNSFLYVLSST